MTLRWWHTAADGTTREVTNDPVFWANVEIPFGGKVNIPKEKVNPFRKNRPGYGKSKDR